MLGAGAARFLSKILTFLGNNLLAFRQISAIFGQCFAYIWARFSWIWAKLLQIWTIWHLGKIIAN